jgi:hypothetical protein
MKIAVCFSGQWRTGHYCYDNLKEFLGILYPMCDFFIHTWDINKQKCYNLSNVFSKEAKLSETDINNINLKYNPKQLLIEDYNFTVVSVRYDCEWINILYVFYFHIFIFNL